MRLRDKVAMISGGGSGIGEATARRFTAEGARVAVLGRNADRVAGVARDTGAQPIAGDAADEGDVDEGVHAVLDAFGRLDVVVACAGGRGTPGVLNASHAEMGASLESNLMTAFVLTKSALPALIESRGAIVLVASLAAHAAAPDNAGYTASKHALIGLARSLARDYGPLGVRTNVVSPGWVRTAMADVEMDRLVGAGRASSREEAYALTTSDVPLRRPATPEEIASICLFLAGDDSSYVNGAVIMADGGSSIVDVPTLAFGREG